MTAPAWGGRAERMKHLEMDRRAAFTTKADWFTAHLFRLIAKSDRSNVEKIRLGFPDEVEVYETWRAGDTDVG